MSIKKSIYETLILESNDGQRSIDISTGAISVDYYEDLFSPTITAKIKVVNTGNTIVAEDGTDRQSIYNGLPLRGGERVSMKISGNSQRNPGLDFSKRIEDYFYVSSISDVISETNQESFTLHLVSREAITNETARVGKKFKVDSTIDKSVKDILNQYLKTNKIGEIDKTHNGYGFIGNMRKPFTILVWLSSKSVPVLEKPKEGIAGFFFYQTRDGFQFRSIDSLIGQPIRKTITGENVSYRYNQVNEAYDESNDKVDNDFKILNYYVEKNQNLVEKLRLGTYSSQRIFFNPLDFSFSGTEEGKYKSTNYINKTQNLGRKLKLPLISEGSSQTLGDVPTRIITAILDVGTMSPNVSQKINYNPKIHQSQSITRYNTLFTQTLNIIVPSNTNLRAGDIIECYLPKITQSKVKEYDLETSGLYMIKELCHHFDSTSSYTSMKLVRDTFGPSKK